jgi:hypothetical protein
VGQACLLELDMKKANVNEKKIKESKRILKNLLIRNPEFCQKILQPGRVMSDRSATTTKLEISITRKVYIQKFKVYSLLEPEKDTLKDDKNFRLIRPGKIK